MLYKFHLYYDSVNVTIKLLWIFVWFLHILECTSSTCYHSRIDLIMQAQEIQQMFWGELQATVKISIQSEMYLCHWNNYALWESYVHRLANAHTQSIVYIMFPIKYPWGLWNFLSQTNLGFGKSWYYVHTLILCIMYI